MHIQLSFQRTIFEAAIAQKVAEAYRPRVDPFPVLPGDTDLFFRDGIRIESVELSTASQLIDFTINELNADGIIVPVSSITPLAIHPLLAEVHGTLFIVNESLIEISPTDANPRDAALPVSFKRNLLLSLVPVEGDVDIVITEVPDGIGDQANPQPMQPPRAISLNIASALAGLRPSGKVTKAGVPIPYDSRVLNASLTLSTLGNPIILVEFVPTDVEPGAYALPTRVNSWTNYFAQAPADVLGTRNWALTAPMDLVARHTKIQLDAGFNSEATKKHFNYANDSAVSFTPNGFKITASGTVDCGLIEPDVDLDIRVSLDVPAPNVLRSTIKLDYDVDNTELIACVGWKVLTFPFTGIEAVASNAMPWYVYAGGLALWFVMPVWMIAGIGVLGLGAFEGKVDATIGDQIAKQQPRLERIGDLEFRQVQPFDTPAIPGIEAMTLREIFFQGSLATLRGDVDISMPVMPLITGYDRLLFGFWFLNRSCDRMPTKGDYQTMAQIIMAVDGAGDGEDDRRPTVPWVGPTGLSTPVPQILEDPRGVYSIEAKGRLFRIWASNTFGGDPYDCILRFVTNGGVRQIRIPAPLPAPTLPFADDPIKQAHDYMAWKGRHCWRFGSLLLSGYLEVLWLPYPPERIRVGQIWQITIDGLREGDIVRAFDADSGRSIAAIQARDHINELSFALPAGHDLRAVQLTRNRERPLSRERYERFAAAKPLRVRESSLRVRLHQTLLVPLGALEFPAAVHSVQLLRGDAGLRLETRLRDGQQFLHSLDQPERPRPLLWRESADTLRDSRPRLPSRVPLVGRLEDAHYLVSEDTADQRWVARYDASVPRFLMARKGRLVALPAPGGRSVEIYQIMRGLLRGQSSDTVLDQTKEEVD